MKIYNMKIYENITWKYLRVVLYRGNYVKRDLCGNDAYEWTSTKLS